MLVAAVESNCEVPRYCNVSRDVWAASDCASAASRQAEIRNGLFCAKNLSKYFLRGILLRDWYWCTWNRIVSAGMAQGYLVVPRRQALSSCYGFDKRVGLALASLKDSAMSCCNRSRIFSICLLMIGIMDCIASDVIAGSSRNTF